MGGFFGSFMEGRKAQILDAALAVFAEKGFEGGTMREIAARVGVSEPALYRHYESKDALLCALVETAGGRLVSTALAFIEAADATTLRPTLSALIADRRALVRSDSGLVRTLLVSTQHNPPARDVFSRVFIQPMAEGLVSLAARVDASLGIERSAEEARAKARMLINLFVGHVMTSELLGEASDDDALVSAVAALMGWPDAR